MTQLIVATAIPTAVFLSLCFCARTGAEDRIFSLRAEFKAYTSSRKDTVTLKTPQGKTVDVPVESLSDDDRKAIAAASKLLPQGERASGEDLGVPEPLRKVEADARLCRTAAEAVLVYRIFLASPELPNDVREPAESRLAHWSTLEREGKVRIGDMWITEGERKAIQAKADRMVRHARELLRLGRIKLAHDELTTSSKLDPENGKADFFLGLVASLIHDDDKTAMEHFRETTRREPNHACGYNNLAVSGFYARRTTSMAENFQKALELSSEPQVVADNIGRIITVGGVGATKIPDRHLKSLNDLYRLALRELNLAPLDSDTQLAPIFVSPYGKAWDGQAGEALAKSGKDMAGDEAVYVGSGSGFVVAAGYVVTNHHVVAGADQVVILDPATKKELPATVVASMQKPDLAVLQCESLQAPAIPLRKQFPGRGADLMVLGYPKGRLLGLGIKSTRGSVIAMPDADIGGFLHSAMSARGNSGGPIVDQSGSLIGVVVGGFEFQENTYSIGISVDEVWPFVSQHVPDFTGAEPSKAMPSWTDVDAMVSQSAVFIQVKKRLNSRSDE